MGATAISMSGLSVEVERDQNCVNHRQFWRYHIVSGAQNQRIFSGAAGDLKEVAETVKAYVSYLVERGAAAS